MPLLGVEKSFLKKIKRIFVQTIDFFLCKKCRGKFPRWTLKTEYTFVKTSVPVCESTSRSIAVRHEA